MQQRDRKRKPNQSRNNNQRSAVASEISADSYQAVISQAGSATVQKDSHPKIILAYHEHAKRFWSFDASAPNLSKENFLALLKLVDISTLKQFENFQTLFARYPLSDVDLFDIATFAISRNNFAVIQYLFEVQGCKQLPLLVAAGSKTLLHEACYYGSKEIIEFLLSKGAEINAVYNGIDRPIHLLIKNKKNDVNLLAVLQKYGADLDEVDPLFCISLLHRAKVYQNDMAVEKLIELGANSKIECGGFTYLEFENIIKRSKDSNPKLSKILQILRSPYPGNVAVCFEDSAFCEWWNLLFLPLKNSGFRTFQQNHKLLFEKIFKNYYPGFPVDLFLCAASSFFLSSNLSLGQIKHFCKSYAPSKKIPHFLLATMLSDLVDFFLSCREVITINELATLMLEMVVQSEFPAGDKARFYINASKAFLNTGSVEQGRKAVSDGLLLLDSAPNPKLSASLFYNLCLIEELANQPVELSIQKAHELLPQDIEIAVRYYIALFTQKKYEAAIALCERFLPDKRWKTLLISVEYRTGQKTKSELSWFLDQDKDEFDFLQDKSEIQFFVSDVRQFFYMELGKYEIALEIAKRRFNTIISTNSLPRLVTNFLAKLLGVYIGCKKYEEGLKFFDEIIQKYPFVLSIGLRIKELLIALYLANNQFEKAEALASEIKLQMTPLVRQRITRLLVAHIPNQNPQSAIAYLDKVIALYPDQADFYYYRHLFSALIHDQKLTSASAGYFDPEVLANTALQNDLVATSDTKPSAAMTPESLQENLSPSSTEDEYYTSEASLYWEYDQAKIHRYFQEQKAKELLAFAQEYQGAFKSEAGTSWVINGKMIRSNDQGVISLNSIFCPNVSIALDPTLKLDVSILSLFERALGKGLCLRRQDEEGVIMVKNSVVYVKVLHEDIRIGTTKVYINTDGQRFHLLDRIFDHDTLDKLRRKPKPFEVVLTSMAAATPESIGSKLPLDSVFSPAEQQKKPNSDRENDPHKSLNF